MLPCISVSCTCGGELGVGTLLGTGSSFWLVGAGRCRQCGGLVMTALILLWGLRENVFTGASKGLPSTQLNYLDGKLIRGFETNHPKMVDANLQLTHQLTLSEGRDETLFKL